MNEIWLCQCGIENNGNFCKKCGRRRPEIIQENNKFSHTTGNSKSILGIGIILIVAIVSVALGYMLTNDDSVPTARQNTTTKQKVSSGIANTNETEKSTFDTNVEDNPITMELSLGKLQMGDTIQYVKSIMGQELKRKKEYNLTRYYYPDLEVVFQHDAVVLLVSASEKISTKRGIHQGSDFNDVTAKYGMDYQYFEYDNLKMYEYPYTLPGGGNGLLRFAVNKSNNKVNYISARMLLD